MADITRRTAKVLINQMLNQYKQVIQDCIDAKSEIPAEALYIVNDYEKNEIGKVIDKILHTEDYFSNYEAGDLYNFFDNIRSLLTELDLELPRDVKLVDSILDKEEIRLVNINEKAIVNPKGKVKFQILKAGEKGEEENLSRLRYNVQWSVEKIKEEESETGTEDALEKRKAIFDQKDRSIIFNESGRYKITSYIYIKDLWGRKELADVLTYEQEVKTLSDTAVSERLDEIKNILKNDEVNNESENELIVLIESFNDEELLLIQEELYNLQKQIYIKIQSSNNKRIRQFFNSHRKGLFVTKDGNGNILNISYTPGNDVVFINSKGELIEYKKHTEGSRSQFFGDALGIGQKRADWMMQVAGYDYDNQKGMNVPTTNAKRSVFKNFNIYGNELKIELLPKYKKDKVKCEVFKKYPEIYAKFGDRISGINGKIIELDNGKGKVIGNVPYFHQCDNETKDGPDNDKNRVHGGVMCQLTSLAMALASKGVKSKDSSKQLEDLLYEIAKKKDFGYGKSKKIWGNIQDLYKNIIPQIEDETLIDSNGLEFEAQAGYKEYDDEKLSYIKSSINSGTPIIVDLKYSNNNGHVVLCIGYTESSLIMHDPYGNLKNGSNNDYGGDLRDYNGAFVEYPQNKYEIGNYWIRKLVNKEIKK